MLLFESACDFSPVLSSTLTMQQVGVQHRENQQSGPALRCYLEHELVQRPEYVDLSSGLHINSSPPLDSLITGSWDRTIRFWDPRAATAQQSSTSLPERVYHMDLVNHTLVVAMASRIFHIYDIRNMSAPSQSRESSLKYMTRALACMTDGQGGRRVDLVFSPALTSESGYATASVEGRIAVEYFDPSPEVQEKKYAFKCHRQTIDDVDHVWPVNSLAFHPV